MDAYQKDLWIRVRKCNEKFKFPFLKLISKVIIIYASEVNHSPEHTQLDETYIVYLLEPPDPGVLIERLPHFLNPFGATNVTL